MSSWKPQVAFLSYNACLQAQIRLPAQVSLDSNYVIKDPAKGCSEEGAGNRGLLRECRHSRFFECGLMATAIPRCLRIVYNACTGQAFTKQSSRRARQCSQAASPRFVPSGCMCSSCSIRDTCHYMCNIEAQTSSALLGRDQSTFMQIC